MWIFSEKSEKTVDKIPIKKYIIPLYEGELYHKTAVFHLDLRWLTQKLSKWLIGKMHIKKITIKIHNGIL